jgi:adenylate cyclase
MTWFREALGGHRAMERARAEGTTASGRALERTVRWLLMLVICFANLVGTGVVFALSFLVLGDVGPGERPVDLGTVAIANVIAAGSFILLAVPLGTWLSVRKVRTARGWLIAERDPTPAEQRAVLRAPLSIFFVLAISWLFAAFLFGALNTIYDLELGVRVAVTIALGGITTCAISYLLSERLIRPIAARALAGGAPDRTTVPGVTARGLLAWALGSAVPVFGLMSIAISTLVEQDHSRQELAIAILALGGTALVVGLLMALLGARATADPIVSIRRALRRVEEGELDVEVPVYDGSEIGLMQSGFNEMAAGLRERERIRDLFGRQVGQDVAHAALGGEMELGGEVRDVAVLFADVVGSTELAATTPPEEVVALLNRFFGVVVEVVGRHGGWINKFEGDATLAVFGAPVSIDDAAGCALGAARELARRLDEEIPGMRAGIGVAAGPAVAGNVGAEHRYEYTVIGDPVNEAARLTEHAKGMPGRVAASWEAVEMASDDEQRHWRAGESVRLRGRARPTKVALAA